MRSVAGWPSSGSICVKRVIGCAAAHAGSFGSPSIWMLPVARLATAAGAASCGTSVAPASAGAPAPGVCAASVPTSHGARIASVRAAGAQRLMSPRSFDGAGGPEHGLGVTGVMQDLPDAPRRGARDAAATRGVRRGLEAQAARESQTRFP